MLANCRGFTLFELLIVLAVFGVLIGMAALNLRPLNSPLQTGTSQIMGFFKQARAKAIATTSAYKVEPASATRLITKYASSCSALTMTTDTDLTLDLPAGVSLTATDWSVCFNSRGVADGNITVTLTDSKAKTRTVEVFLGGGVRIQP